jgi:DNA polymerase elongation subunit (family B)
MNSRGEGVKKKYAGRMIWYDGKEVDKVSIVGFESKRSDNPEIGRKFMEEILKKILYKNAQREIDEYISNFKKEVREGKYEPERLAFPIGITKSLESYANQIHAKAARLANKKFNSGIKVGDKIKYIFVKHPDKVIAFKTYMPEGYKIDYDMILRRIVDLKIIPLYSSLGWETKHLNTQLSYKIDKRELDIDEIYKQRGLW